MELHAPLPFDKMHGSGNDFIVVQLPEPLLQDIDLSEFTLRVCRRGMGIGADGVILISPSEQADFHWRYINADGSDGDMCGNGAMVGARYAVEHGIAPSQCSFDTAAGIVHAEVDGDHVSLAMVNAQLEKQGLRFDALPAIDFDLFTIGVPHVVGFVEDADAVANLHALGKTIRHDPQVQPAGANVNLVHRIDEHTIRMRTYERGVEAETLACGTGAVCSAISSVRHGLVSQPVTVRVSSGMNLTVTWREQGDSMMDIRLSGTARVVARGEITSEALL